MLKRSNLHHYQERGVEFIKENKEVALWLGLGMGKSIITLTAIVDLLKEKEATKVLLVAPLRVIQSVWEQEAKKWEHTKQLRFVNLSGGKKNMIEGLKKEGDIYLINRENVAALVEYAYPHYWLFNTLVIDEASSFKNYASKRFKALKKVRHLFKYSILLTGTPNPNGYMDIWSQFYILDGGKRLERNITAYRNRYFTRDFLGYNYNIMKGAEKKIQNRIKDITLSMQSEDYLEVPEMVPIIMETEFPPKLLKQYKELKKEMLLELEKEGEAITAVSAAVLSNKLLQFCSGNVYDENGTVHHFHDLKVDMLKEILEDYPDENLLVAYNFRHELDTLKRAFPFAKVLSKSGKEVEDWNSGKIRMLLANPKSAGMGLNLQEGGNIIVWYSFTWNLEDYLQFNARLHRQGQKKPVTVLHLAVGDIEKRLMRVLTKKENTLKDLLHNIKGELDV